MPKKQGTLKPAFEAVRIKVGGKVITLAKIEVRKGIKL